MVLLRPQHVSLCSMKQEKLISFVCTIGLMGEIDDDDDNFDNQNTTDDPGLTDHSNVDQTNTRDDAIGCFKNHTGLPRGTCLLRCLEG